MLAERFGMAVAVLVLAGAAVRAAELDPVLDGVRWGEDSRALVKSFGARAIRLSPPIEFGDSYVDVALRGQSLGGYDFAVYFQMDKATRRLKRVMLERQRHGANPMVYRAVLAALTRDYGAPAAACHARPLSGNGYQAAGERVWLPDGLTIRAVFNDTTIEAEEGCTSAGAAACGLTGHLFVQILPRAPGTGPCG